MEWGLFQFFIVTRSLRQPGPKRTLLFIIIDGCTEYSELSILVHFENCIQHDTHAYACDLKGPQVGLGMTEYRKPLVSRLHHTSGFSARDAQSWVLWAVGLRNFGEQFIFSLELVLMCFRISRSCPRCLPHSLRLGYLLILPWGWAIA